MVNYSLLEWDTKAFGYKIAQLNVKEESMGQIQDAIRKLKEENFKLAYCYLSPEDKTSNDSILSCSGLLVDEKVTYSLLVDDTSGNNLDEHVEYFTKKNVPKELRSLTLQSGAYSRFKVDPNFKNDEYVTLYNKWIEKSVSGELADHILVYKEGDQILGFITLKIGPVKGTIGLLAVDERSRGKSIGKKLLSSSLSHFIKNNVNIIEVVTQKNNQIACMFYEKCGFSLSQVVNVYHIWIK